MRSLFDTGTPFSQSAPLQSKQDKRPDNGQNGKSVKNPLKTNTCNYPNFTRGYIESPGERGTRPLAERPRHLSGLIRSSLSCTYVKLDEGPEHKKSPGIREDTRITYKTSRLSVS